MNSYSIKFHLVILIVCTTLLPSTVAADNPTFTNEAREIVAELPAVVGADSVDYSELENQPVLVTFFASWCPPCFEEFVQLNKLQNKYADSDLGIIAINVHEAWTEADPERMQRFIDTTSPVFPAVVGSEEIRELFGGIDRIPTVYGFDRKGELVYRFIHKRKSTKTNATFDELEEAAKVLLASD